MGTILKITFRQPGIDTPLLGRAHGHLGRAAHKEVRPPTFGMGAFTRFLLSTIGRTGKTFLIPATSRRENCRIVCVIPASIKKKKIVQE